MREEKKKKGFLSCILSYFLLLLLPVLGFEFCLLWIFVGLDEGTRRDIRIFFPWVGRSYTSSASFSSLTSLLSSMI